MAVLHSQGKHEDADLACLRAIKIQESALGPDHPELATSLCVRSQVLQAQVTCCRYVGMPLGLLKAGVCRCSVAFCLGYYCAAICGIRWANAMFATERRTVLKAEVAGTLDGTECRGFHPRFAGMTAL